MKKTLWAIPAVLTLTLASACAPADDKSDDTDKASGDCAVESLALQTSGKLTVATDDPAYEPWFADNDPSNGKGFESAVTYAIAEEMGFDASDVVWTKVPFNTSYQPGKKAFDFDINQISITKERREAIDFSEPYYTAAQAIIVKADSKFAKATSLADFKDAQLGAQIGTTSLKAIGQIGATKDALVYDDTTKAAAAFDNGNIDGFVADLPSAFYLTAVELDNAVIVGQFAPETGEPEQFGLLLEKGSKLTGCVDKAIKSLKENGELAKIEAKWLSEGADAPVLK